MTDAAVNDQSSLVGEGGTSDLRAKLDEDTRRDIQAEGTQAMTEINDQLRVLLEQAPSDSTAELLVRKTNQGYKGMLKIFSTQRRFVGGSQATKFADVIREIFSEVRLQIDDWKRNRFAHSAE